jgi:chemotaxis protein MotA
MDLGVLIGIPLGLFCIIMSILISGFSMDTYMDLIAVFITIGGSFAALMVGTPMDRLRKVWTIFNIALRSQNLRVEEIIPRLVTFSEKSRREGLLSLEDDLETIEDDFFREGIQLVVDGTDPDVIKNVLFNEMNQLQQRHKGGIDMFDFWSKLTPAFGMIGTLFGLVGMLRSLGDPTSIGVGMAAALITTFYGAIMCYLILLPIKKKLEERDINEILVKEIILEGILSIQTGDNPRIVEQKLLAFLDPNTRGKVKQTE